MLMLGRRRAMIVLGVRDGFCDHVLRGVAHVVRCVMQRRRVPAPRSRGDEQKRDQSLFQYPVHVIRKSAFAAIVNPLRRLCQLVGKRLSPLMPRPCLAVIAARFPRSGWIG